MHRLKKELFDLIKSEDEIFSFIEDSSLDGMWYWDLEDPEHEWMSASFWRTLGYEPSEKQHLASEWQDIINQDDLNHAIANFTKHCENPEHPYDQIVRYRHRDGSTVWIRCRGMAVRNKDGKAIRMFGAHTDVTALKQAEQDKLRIEQEKNQRLQQLQNRLNVLLENVPGAYFQYSINNEGVEEIEFMSQGCLDIWELTPEQLEHNVEALWNVIDREDVDALSQSIQSSAEHETKWQHEWRITTISGKRKWLRGVGTPKKHPCGKVSWNSLIMDVTEQKEQQDTIARMQRMETIGHLAAGISHDINNILAIINGHREIVEYKSKDDSIKPHLDKIKNATHRASQLTHRLLLSSRKSATSVAADTLLIDSLSETKALLQEITPRNISVNWQVEEARNISVNSNEFQDVITNLYVNAMNALGENGRIVVKANKHYGFSPPYGAYVYISPCKSQSYIELTVTDNGCGIESHELENIFIPFVSLSKKKEGTGLGLAMVAGYASRNEVGISVLSVPGEGTSVSLWFPYGETTEVSTQQEKRCEHEPEPLRLAIIDDEPDIVEMASEILRLHGHDCVCFGNAEEAFYWLRENQQNVDIILSDMVMPGSVQGQHIYDEFNAKTPVVLMSGYFELSHLGCKDAEVLKKPFTLSSLMESLSTAQKRTLIKDETTG